MAFAFTAVFFAGTVSVGFVTTWVLNAPPLAWSQWISGLVVALATMVVLSRRLRPRQLAAAALVSAATVFAASVAMLVFLSPSFGPWQPRITAPELFGLGLLVLLAVRRCGVWEAVAVVAAAGLAVTSAPLLRLGASETLVLESFLTLLLVTASVSTGLFLRVLEAVRAHQVSQARREERLALARDVHDTVAHHMTGIIVQAQALRHVAERDPVTAMQALGQIERAGNEALTATRQVVATLRDGGAPAPRAPEELHATLRRLTEASDTVPVRLAMLGETDTPIPADVSAAVLRIGQEAVANARRHATDATQIDMEVRIHSDALTLRVRDDGDSVGSRGGARGVTGHGLAGIAERVQLLGGESIAGPTGDRGWHVLVSLPLTQDES